MTRASPWHARYIGDVFVGMGIFRPAAAVYAATEKLVLVLAAWSRRSTYLQYRSEGHNEVAMWHGLSWSLTHNRPLSSVLAMHETVAA